MKREIAEQVVGMVTRGTNEIVATLDVHSESTLGPTENARFADAIGRVAAASFDAVAPILSEHPDLLELPEGARPVLSQALVVGGTYFRLVYPDADLLMPAVTPLVFVGPAPDGERLYFQDAEAYLRGDRIDAAVVDDATVERWEYQPDQLNTLFEFESLLDQLWECRQRRRSRTG